MNVSQNVDLFYKTTQPVRDACAKWALTEEERRKRSLTDEELEEHLNEMYREAGIFIGKNGLLQR